MFRTTKRIRTAAAALFLGLALAVGAGAAHTQHSAHHSQLGAAHIGTTVTPADDWPWGP